MTARFEEYAGQVDVVFDTVGGETLERSWGILSRKGRLVTVVWSAEYSTDPRVKNVFFIVEPNQKQLFEIADLLDTGRVCPVVDSVIPLPQVPEVYAGKIQRQGQRKTSRSNFSAHETLKEALSCGMMWNKN